MRHLELFAGIGGFRHAMDLLQADGVMHFESVGFSEIDAEAIKTYKANYIIQATEVELGDIVHFTSDNTNIIGLPDFDLLTGGFPCQTFSLMGGQKGFGEERGKMFFMLWKILREKRPRYVLLENVKNLATHNRGRTYATIEKKLKELGYNVSMGIFNSSDFGLPQHRNRVLIFATTEDVLTFDIGKEIRHIIDFFEEVVRHRTSLKIYTNVLDVLTKDADEKYYLSERVKPTILSDGTGGFVSKSEINKFIARPLTASMHKMHRACQDNYYSRTFIETNGQVNDAEGLSKMDMCKLPIRKLTPKEAFMLQGFPPEFVYNAHQAGVSNGALYKQAGNAVSVNLIYTVLYYLIQTGYINGQ